MIAVKGLYENGRIELSEDAPVEKAKVIVIFLEEKSAEKHIIGKSAKELFEEFTGCLSRPTGEKAEHLGT